VKRADAARAEVEIAEVEKMAATIQSKLAGRIEAAEEKED
jgi:hypothetical protein